MVIGSDESPSDLVEHSHFGLATERFDVAEHFSIAALTPVEERASAQRPRHEAAECESERICFIAVPLFFKT